MSILSQSDPSVTGTSNYLSSIDAKAEREGAALAFFEDELDVRQPADPIRARRDECHAAAARGLPPVQHYRYDRTAAALAWCGIVDAFRAGKTPRVRPYLDTRADRVRQAKRRLEKLGRALELKSLPDKPVDVPRAAALTGISARAISRAAREGRLPARLVKRHNTRFYSIHVADLASYAYSRVSA